MRLRKTVEETVKSVIEFTLHQNQFNGKAQTRRQNIVKTASKTKQSLHLNFVTLEKNLKSLQRQSTVAAAASFFAATTFWPKQLLLLLMLLMSGPMFAFTLA